MMQEMRIEIYDTNDRAATKKGVEGGNESHASHREAVKARCTLDVWGSMARGAKQRYSILRLHVIALGIAKSLVENT